MPNRIIREGMLSSETVNSLSWQGECFFYRLMLKADDFGRYDAREPILRASLFPLRISQVREADITRWMAECQKAGLIVLYETDGKRFLEIPKFGQRRRAMHSKWPRDDSQVSVTCPSSAHEGERREAKTRSEGGQNAANESQPASDDFAWLASLQADPAYLGIDVAREHAKMSRWCQTNHKEPTRRRFINWLNRAEKPLVIANGHKPKPPKDMRDIPEKMKSWMIENNFWDRDRCSWKVMGDIPAAYVGSYFAAMKKLKASEKLTCGYASAAAQHKELGK